MPGNIRVRGRQLPITAVLGGIGTFAAWVSVHGAPRRRTLRRHRLDDRRHRRLRRLPPPQRDGPDLATTRSPHRERPAFFVELDYRSAIVPIFGTDVDASALRAAARLVGEGALVEAVYVLRVPNQLSLDAGLDEEEQLGLSVLESAKLTGRKAGLKMQTRLIRTRNPGLAIVEEAQRSRRRDHLPRDRARAAIGARARADGELPARAPPVPGRDRDAAGTQDGRSRRGRIRHRSGQLGTPSSSSRPANR